MICRRDNEFSTLSLSPLCLNNIVKAVTSSQEKENFPYYGLKAICQFSDAFSSCGLLQFHQVLKIQNQMHSIQLHYLRHLDQRAKTHDERRSSSVCFHVAIVARATISSEILVCSTSVWLPTASPKDNITAWQKRGEKDETGTSPFHIRGAHM